MVGKVFLEEHPGATHLGARDQAGFGAAPQLFRVTTQELRRFV